MSVVDVDPNYETVTCVFHARGYCYFGEECVFVHEAHTTQNADFEKHEVFEQQCRSQLRAIKMQTNEAVLPPFPPNERRPIESWARRMHLKVCFSSQQKEESDENIPSSDAVLIRQRITENFFRRGHSANKSCRRHSHNRNYELVYMPAADSEGQHVPAFESPAVRRRKASRDRSRSSRRSRSNSIARPDASSTDTCAIIATESIAPECVHSGSDLPCGRRRKLVKPPVKASEKSPSLKKAERTRKKRQAQKTHHLEDERSGTRDSAQRENVSWSGTATASSKPSTNSLQLNKTFLYLAGDSHPEPLEFDIRDEICERFDFWQHGDRVWVLEDNKKATVIGVAPLRGVCRLFVHVDGSRGAVPACSQSLLQIGLPIAVQQHKVEKIRFSASKDLDAELLRKLDVPSLSVIKMQLMPDVAAGTLAPHMFATFDNRIGPCQTSFTSVLLQHAEYFHGLYALPAPHLPWLDIDTTLQAESGPHHAASDVRSGSRGVRFAGDKPPADDVDKVIKLSQEQSLAVSTSCSSFIQGRSGTGKTLILVKRILQHRLVMQQNAKKEIFKQLFVKKSSLLCEEVFFQLKSEGCLADRNVWPLRNGVVILSWNQLLMKVLGRDAQDDTLVTFNVFSKDYWPQLQSSARALPAELVWAEFNTRLRPFGPAMAMGMENIGIWHATFDEYFEEDCSAMGMGLDRESQTAIFGMFKKYQKIKQADHAQDEVDRALALSRAIAMAKEQSDALYVDEIQDFHPAEICSLLALCKDFDAITMAGDTCQTVNPGSAFKFDDLVKAFRQYRRGKLINTIEGKNALRKIETLQDDALRSERQARQATESETRRSRKKLIASALFVAGKKVYSHQGASTVSSVKRGQTDDLALAAHFAQERQRLGEEEFEKLTKRFAKLTLHFNYRCSPGVAHLASSVTQLLLHRFPSCADAIVEETVLPDERLPIHLRMDGKSPADILMGTGAQRIQHIDESRIVILVQTDRMREHLKDSGVRGLILTVPEAKGLEFDIVILCGLCSGDATRNMLWSLADDHSFASQLVMRAAGQPQELNNHEREFLRKIVLAISELKRLYVGISRGRIGCVLMECDLVAEDAFAPMVQRWCKTNLIEQWLDFGTSMAADSGTESLVAALYERYGRSIDDLAMITKLKARGEQLFRHAQDEPIQRLQVFLESVNVFSHTLKCLKQWFRSQLHGGVALLDTPLLVDVKTGFQCSTGLEDVTSVIIQEIARRHCWHSRSHLSMLQGRWHVLASILGFLAPASTNVENLANDVVQKLHHHDNLAYKIKQQIFSTHGWYNKSCARQSCISKSQRLQLKHAISTSVNDFAYKLEHFASAKSQGKLMDLQNRYLKAACFHTLALPIIQWHNREAERDLHEKKESEEAAARKLANVFKAEKKAVTRSENIRLQKLKADEEHAEQQENTEWWQRDIKKDSTTLAEKRNALREARLGESPDRSQSDNGEKMREARDMISELEQKLEWMKQELKKSEKAKEKAAHDVERAETNLAHARAMHDKAKWIRIDREKERLQAEKDVEEAAKHMHAAQDKLQRIQLLKSKAYRLLANEEDMRTALFKESQCDFAAWQKHARELWQLSCPIADKLSAAGRAFLLSSEHQGAADAFEMALEWCGSILHAHTTSMFDKEPWASFKSLWCKVPFVRNANMQHQMVSHWFAYSKLLLARETNIKNQSILVTEAEPIFASARAYITAALCAMSAGNFKGALLHLLNCSSPTAKQLVLLCAVQISDVP